ncbi:MAG TPA: thioredoxin-dependent thiol peroxidase [Alphaproteobacteria bacterium]
MFELNIGDKAPDFTLPASGGETISLKSLKGQPVVLYFYPKDMTSGCTQESCDFRDNLKAFNKIGAKVIGISRDSVKSHDKFIQKENLNFPLVSDEDGAVCAKYGTWVEKSMYGRKYMGIERTTFLIDADGKIAAIWRKVSVPGHVNEVLESLQTLDKQAA